MVPSSAPRTSWLRVVALPVLGWSLIPMGVMLALMGLRALLMDLYIRFYVWTVLHP